MELNEREAFVALQTAFETFKSRSEQLAAAYGSMEKQFEKLTVELDEKNRKLEEAHSVLDSILSTMHNGVIAVNTSEIITHFNSAAQKTTGYSANDAVGSAFREFFGDKGLSEKNVLDVLKSGKGYDRDEKIIWNKDGSPVPVVYQSSLLRNAHGELLGAVEIFNDISKIKQLESENQQNRVLAALGEMAATLAHEIKNPLGAMGTWARLLDKSFETDDKRKQTIGKIIDALSRLNKIVSSMLIFGRQSKPQLQTLNLKPLLSEFVDSMEIEVVFGNGTQIEVNKEWDEAPLIVQIDPEKFRQVLMNIALNSVQAMGETGILRVSCKTSEREDGNYAIISIADTGPGIPKNELERIFTPFHTTKEDGTGLGLAIVKKLVDFHGGVIDVESEIGKGAVFHIFLPLK
ncbi:MAG: PAS domain S-box protein [Chitinispirillales bacterium]|jgi:PAS domain S-box-containing protein|nr:PAS domain S-box protein [Chitinispirillales bacterium]